MTCRQIEKYKRAKYLKTYHCTLYHPRACFTTFKLLILKGQNRNILNKRSELKCRYVTKHHL